MKQHRAHSPAVQIGLCLAHHLSPCMLLCLCLSVRLPNEMAEKWQVYKGSEDAFVGSDVSSPICKCMTISCLHLPLCVTYMYICAFPLMYVHAQICIYMLRLPLCVHNHISVFLSVNFSCCCIVAHFKHSGWMEHLCGVAN